mmetsp:Transcript_32806/g.35370  ORF Transcript_32806/g.35370 Transcript_32806/m.35370 type:complete len:389 (+) Transcript_32806:65-1231(+)
MKDNDLNCDEIAPTFEVALSRVSFSTLANPVVLNGIRVLSSSTQISVYSKKDEIGKDIIDSDENIFRKSSDDDVVICSRMNIRVIIPLAIDNLLGYIRFLFPFVFKKKEPVFTGKGKVNILVASSSSLMKKLPQAILLEVMTFLYDDLPSIQSMLCSSKVLLMAFSHRNIIINHIRQVITNSSTTPFCTLCSNPVTYPHQLKDCNHVACGRCIWKATSDGNAVYMSSNCKNANCKIKIRSRPLRVSAEQNRLANVRAFWLLSENGNTARFLRNDRRIHKGTAGYFGKNGIQHERGVFDGKGFPGDFDDTETIKFADIDHKLSNLDEWDVCMCPADHNYSGFPMGTATNLTSSMLRGLDEEDVIILQRWNRNLDHCDDYEIEEEYCLIG